MTEVLTPDERESLSAHHQGDLRRVRQRLCEEFAPVVADPAQAMLMDELIEISAMAVGLKARKRTVRAALMHIASAQGAHETHVAWQELAATAMLMADSVRPRPQAGVR